MPVAAATAVATVGAAAIGSVTSNRASRRQSGYNQQALAAQQDSERQEREYRAQQDAYQRQQDADAKAQRDAEEARRQQKAAIILGMLGGRSIPGNMAGHAAAGAPAGGASVPFAGTTMTDAGPFGGESTLQAPSPEDTVADFFRRRYGNGNA